MSDLAALQKKGMNRDEERERERERERTREELDNLQGTYFLRSIAAENS
jgi:hypothetical protein